MTDTVSDAFRSGSFGAIIPPAPASATAQSDNTGGPLNIRQIKRGHAFGVCTAAGDKTITSTSWVDVAQELIVEALDRHEDLLLSDIAMKREQKAKRTIPHDKAWK